MSVMELFSLKGKVAVVTGAARGLGKAMSEALADCGADIAVLDIDLNMARQTACEIADKYGVRARAYHVDVAAYDFCQEACDAVMAEYGRIDILLNNAGICINQDAQDMSLNDWTRVIDINMNGVWYMSQIVGRIMIGQMSGNIINLSSMSAFIVNTPQGQVSYNAAKAGVVHMTKSLAAEWADYNIRVNSIAPGYMDTDLVHKTLVEDGPWARKWMEFTPMKRAGRPEELGPLAVYLASDASSFMTGSIVVIDGGYTIW